jgi:FkbM family methyltransferase
MKDIDVASQPPNPTDLQNWAHHMRTLEDAYIVPSSDRGLVQRSGVFDKGMNYCDDAVLWRGQPLMTAPDVIPPDVAASLDVLNGTYLWGGVIHDHFGHFLVESLGRIWGYGEVDGKIDGILFLEKRPKEPVDDDTVRWHSAEDPHLLQFQEQAFTQLGIKVPVGVVRATTKVEKLHVPGQGFGMIQMTVGTPKFKAFVQDGFAKDIAPEGPERLYISRSAFGARRGGIIGEDLIEKRLKKDGYEVFHPQKADLNTQIARYKAAREIIAADGSALHLLAMVAKPDQKIAMIKRRKSLATKGIEAHLASFSGTAPLVIDAINQNWLRSDRQRVDRFSLAELNMTKLGRKLSTAGMATKKNWKSIEGSALNKILAGLEEESNHTFRPQSKHAAADLPDGIVATCHGIQVPGSFAVGPKWLIRKINNGRYEKEEIAGALDLISPSDRVLECGAGIGIVGTTVAHNCKPEKMLSFEANPNLIPVIEATYKHNKVDGTISVTHGALLSGADAPETITFNISKRFAFSSLDAPKRELSEQVTVPVHNFADVKKDFAPTVLLMDIEGGELGFLEGADLSGINVVVMEFHPDIYGIDGMKRCKELLRKAGLNPVAKKSSEFVWAAQRDGQT